MTKETLSNGLVRLTSDNGIYDVRTKQTYAEVITKASKVKYYTDGADIETKTDVKSLKIAESNAYAESLKKVKIGTLEIWATPDERSNYRNLLTAAKNKGIESVSYNGMTLTPEQGLAILDAVELWAFQVTTTKASHETAIKALTSAEEVESYDYTTSYPSQLVITL